MITCKSQESSPTATSTQIRIFSVAMNVSDRVSHAPVEPLQEPYTSLVGAANDHINPSSNLVPSQPEKVEKSAYPTSPVHSTTEVVSEQLRTSPPVEWARNRLVSPIHRLPEEVLSSIFMTIIFSFDHPDTPDSTLMEQDVYEIYRRVYGLLRVCSAWRRVIMTRAVFWSVVPMVESSSTREPRPSELSLQRAGGSKLHLVAVANLNSPNISKGLIEVITKYNYRFDAVSLSIGDHRILVDAINGLLSGENNSQSLAKLSVRYIAASDNLSRLPSDDSYVFRHDDPRQEKFVELVGALTAFRINGVHFRWQTMAFSARLTELWIENITLGHDSAIVPFLQAASSASQLRVLKIITVDTFCRRDPLINFPTIPSLIAFPNLQSLYIRDLYWNTLKSLFRMIAPGPYHLTLFFRETSLRNNFDKQDFNPFEVQYTGFGKINVDELSEYLGRIPVHTLMLSEHSARGQLTGRTLRVLLKAMPALKTLKMHRWEFNESVCSGLKRPQGKQAARQECLFPALERLQLSAATILSNEGFQEMVASYSLQQVTLGATIKTDTSGNKKRPLEEEDDLAKWLGDNVPYFRLVEDRYCPPEFQSVRWEFKC
ncbi:unnamed protein product [Rhizoctonia solani]|uniref:F-box domain-containing protein n=1 Tax=Rhizoctonia solani TaxID=456999 RepID=A0A8H3E3R3_9AGAM|nr:unnamed protein product [Rhizoctonia solani]